MKRRVFITLLGSAAAWPLAGRAQEQMRRIGVLMTHTESDPQPRAWVTALKDGLQGLGWTQDRNVRIDYRWGGGDDDRLRSYAAELVRMAPDVIFAGATPALAALQRETRSLPIVFVQVSDPVKLGIVASLAQPGGNITGFANYEHQIGSKWLELLKDAAPGRTRAIIIFESRVSSQGPYLQAIETAAPLFAVQLSRADVRNAADIERVITSFAQEPNGALIVVPGPVTIRERDLIIALAARHRVPAVYPYRFFASAGGLISYGIDLPDLYRKAAGYVDRILRGAKPGDLPVQLASKFELVINLKSARALGLTIPELFVQSADEVIE